MASSLGVSEHHHTQVVNYLRFARYQRSQSIRGVDRCHKDLRTSRLCDETYTQDEVEEILNDLEKLIRGEVETELINVAHTSVLLLRQVFQQAEKWHLKLQADISELENRELLEKIKDFEDNEFSGTKRDLDLKLSRLEPLNDSGGAALLHAKIKEMDNENESLKSRLRQLGDESFLLQQEKNRLRSDLSLTKKELDGIKPQQTDQSSGEIGRLTTEMSGLQEEINQMSEKNKVTEGGLHGDLVSTKHELLRIQELLELAGKELEKKVSLTTPFKNMKQMLVKKNDQIKTLRQSLAKYEGIDDSGAQENAD